jgi:hypothetical protein
LKEGPYHLFDQAFWRCMLPEPATVIAKVKEKINGVEAIPA